LPSALIEHRVKDVGGRLAYLRELREGLQFVRNNALVLPMVLVATMTNLLDVPLLTVVLPVYARDNYGSAASFGGIVGSLAAGAFLGTLVFGAVGRRLPRRLTFIVSFVVSPMIIYVALLATPPLPALVAATVIGGLVSGPINPTYATVIQEQAPPQMLGRVFGALQSLAMAGIPVGNALTGFAVEGLGVTVTIMAMAVVYLAVTLGMFLRPALRQMDLPAPR